MNPYSPSSAEAEVWEVIQAFNRAFAANDPDTYFSFVDEDMIVITPSNPYRIEGMADDREGFEHDLHEGGYVGFFQELQPNVAVFGEVAIATYYSRGSYGTEGKNKMAYLKETDVLVKKDGTWKIVHVHVSSTVGG